MKNEVSVDVEGVRIALYKYVKDWQQPVQGVVDDLKELLVMSGRPDYIFPPEPGLEIYRGLSAVRPEALKKILGVDDLHDEGHVDFGGMIWPKKKNSTVMSFSSDLELVKREFAINTFPGRYSVVFCADVDDNRGLLLDLSVFYHEYPQLMKFASEWEILALGAVKVKWVSWKKLAEEASN